MRAIVIDSTNKNVCEVDITADFRDIYPLIGNGCTTFACPVQLENGDAMYADDEGLYNQIEGGFMMRGWSYPIVGNAVLLNVDEEGESIDALSDIEDLKSRIVWISKEDAQRWASYALGQTPKIHII